MELVETKNAIQEFLATKPLYVKLKIELPARYEWASPEKIFLLCPICKAERPFKAPVQTGGSGAGVPPPPTHVSGAGRFEYLCTGCDTHKITFWVQINYVGDHWIQKVGQLPIWLPAIPKDIENELGEDAEIYKKALRNMNEGYGIGACAYLRRLVEKHINPLLQLMHDSKAEEGSTPEELEEIKNVIKSHVFSSKTEYAAQICPASLQVKGHNPLLEIHERLSVGLHTLDEETANEYAHAIKDALEFTIRTLRRTLEERRAYAKQIKTIQRLPVK